MKGRVLNLDVFNVLANENRRKLLSLLARGETQASLLVRRTKLPFPEVSQSLAVLLDAGLVKCRRDRHLRYYRLVPAGLRKAQAWLRQFEESA